MVEPFLCHLSYEKRGLGHFLDGNDEPRVCDPNIQPLAENGLGVPHLRLSQVGNGQESLPVRSDQGQKSVPPKESAALPAVPPPPLPPPPPPPPPPMVAVAAASKPDVAPLALKCQMISC